MSVLIAPGSNTKSTRRFNSPSIYKNLGTVTVRGKDPIYVALVMGFPSKDTRIGLNQSYSLHRSEIPLGSFIVLIPGN